MNERLSDFDLLQGFLRTGHQVAFSDLVRRHLDLVYATALRKVEDASAAEEISQIVFARLARKAWQFAPDDSLPAWLHRTTLLEAKQWLRGELRRRRREQTAADLGTTMKHPEEQPALRALVPVLDEALLSLREKDRTALLLRYYESRSLRDVGVSLGIGEDAAQKRVAAAVEQLVRFFQRRGFKTATVAIATAALQSTAVSTSTATAATVATAALQAAPPVLSGLALLLGRVAGLTKAQTAALCVAIIALPIGWQWNEARALEGDAARLKQAVQGAGERHSALESEIKRLGAASERVETELAKASQAQAEYEEVARKLEGLKERFRALSTSGDYRWQDDWPLVRIPKRVLTKVSLPLRAYEPDGRLSSWTEEVLGLTPDDKSEVERQLAAFHRRVEDLITAQATETNVASRASRSSAPGIYKSFAIPPLGDAAAEAWNDLQAGLTQTLGEARQTMTTRERGYGGGWLPLEVLNQRLVSNTVVVTMTLTPRENVAPDLYFSWDSGSRGSAAWSPSDLNELPASVRNMFLPWLQENGYTNVPTAWSNTARP